MVILIPALPLSGALLMLAVGRRLPRPLVSGICSTLVGAAFLLCLTVSPQRVELAPWLPLPGANWAFLIDQLSLSMMRVVTGISFLIHVYSGAYMAREPGFHRYFGGLNLFVGCMLVLVMADNLALTFAGWEGVGVASYLLIGYYFDRPSAAAAAYKAFLVNRLADVAYLLAMFALLAAGHSLGYPEFLQQPESAAVAWLLFLAACGKSAQFPLYIWLPDAMEGPTPVSALIHAATMVTAGIYLIARCQPLFGPAGLTLAAAAGAITALLGGLLASVETDIKRALAYSTVSQLGFMVVALGAGAYAAAMQHLYTHAFFKALLFLAAGSVIHGLHGEQDLRFMGGLRSVMPWTFALMTVGVLAMAGFPGFSGFFSKERIIGEAFHRSPALGAVCLAVSFLTAFYGWRIWRLTFLGERRAASAGHESGVWMLGPMAVLAVGSIVAGWGPVALDLDALGALAATATGILMAHRGVEFPPVLTRLHVTDACAQRVLARGLGLGLGRLLVSTDQWVVDGLVRLLAAVTRLAGRGAGFWDRWVVDGLVRLTGLAVRLASYPVRVLQNGSLQSYAAIFLAGAAFLLYWALVQ